MPSVSYLIFSDSNICLRYSEISFIEICLKSNRCVRDKMVAGTLCASVVAIIKITWGGGSSNVFNNALKASRVSMCTSSII